MNAQGSNHVRSDGSNLAIPVINGLDVLAKFEDGRRNLTIIVATSLDDTPYSQGRLLNKLQNYLAYLDSSDFSAEFGTPTPELVSITVRIHEKSAPLIFQLLEKCENWVTGRGTARLVVERF